MRGRKPQPAAIRELKKDPAKRHRAILEAQGVASLTDAKSAAELPHAPRPDVAVPDWLKSQRARDLYALVVDTFQQQNICRSTDLHAYARWAFYVDQWEILKDELEKLESPFVTTLPKRKKGTARSKMVRPHPCLGMIAQAERLVMSLEDRLGLNPVSRQAYIRALAALPPASPTATSRADNPDKNRGNNKVPKREDDKKPAEPPAPKALAFMRNASRDEETTH